MEPNRRREAADLTVGGAVARFALAGVIALAIVGIVSFFVFRHIGTNEALKDARELTRVVGKGIVEPNLTEGVVKGCLLYTSPSPRDGLLYRMPSSA